MTGELHTDPARHHSLILVEALDLGQVSGRGALHLETLLREWRVFREGWVRRSNTNNPEGWRPTPEAIITGARYTNDRNSFHANAFISFNHREFPTALCSLADLHSECWRVDVAASARVRCCCLTWSQTSSHFLSLSYWLSSVSLSGGRFM